MSVLDLAKPFDLAVATGSSLAQLYLLFGRDTREWDITEASYNGVVFNVFKTKTDYGAGLSSIRDSGGRRLAEFKFPYQDGQTTDDLGRSPETFDVEVVIHGKYYLNGVKALFKELQKPDPGDLVHPVRGVVRCKMRNYQLTHAHDSKQAALLTITFVEHNYDGKWANPVLVDRFDSLLSNVMGSFAVISSLYGKINAAIGLYNAVKGTLTGLVETFEAALRDCLAQTAVVFSKNRAQNFPTILPMNRGGVLLPDGTVSQTTFPTTLGEDDPFRDVPIAQINAQIAAAASNFAAFTEDQAILSTDIDMTNPGLESLANVSIALAANYLQNQVNALREQCAQLIASLQAAQINNPNLLVLGEQSDGALIFWVSIQDLKRSMILFQKMYEAGLKDSQATLKRYTTPRLMSLREVAFANGISPDRVTELDLLNPELDSINYIPEGTEVLVAA